MAKSSASDRGKKAVLDKALRSAFARLQNRPIPDRLMSVVDQLEAADPAPKLKKSGS